MGFGKTGRAVASILLESKETNLQWVIRRSQRLTHRSVPEFLGVESDEPGLIYSKDEFTADELLEQHPVDAIVDFSSDTGLDYYGCAAARRGVTICTAVSMYSPEHLERLRRLSEDTTVMHSPNITLGINFLIIAAQILKRVAPYTDIEIVEEHFKRKVEVSGTARLIASALELPDESVKSIRAGGIIGVHEILFGFPYQTIRLRHESISREAFGNGILFALNHLEGKPKGMYQMEDLLLPYFRVGEVAEEMAEIVRRPWWKRFPVWRRVAEQQPVRGGNGQNGTKTPPGNGQNGAVANDQATVNGQNGAVASGQAAASSQKLDAPNGQAEPVEKAPADKPPVEKTPVLTAPPADSQQPNGQQPGGEQPNGHPAGETSGEAANESRN